MKWISTKTRMPEVYNPVLVSNGKKIFTAIRCIDDGIYSFQFSICPWCENDDEITHWMPLPEVPKGEKRWIGD